MPGIVAIEGFDDGLCAGCGACMCIGCLQYRATYYGQPCRCTGVDAAAASRPGDAHVDLDQEDWDELQEHLRNPPPNPAAVETLRRARQNFGVERRMD